ncbi:MAG: helix-turn-helix domain-containing protein [Dehalobacterium sp.]
MEKTLLSVAEAAKLMPGVNRQSIYRWAREGTIPSVRVGTKRILIPAAAIQKMVDDAMKSMNIKPGA